MDHSPPNSGPASQEPSRRRFMKGGAALGAALVAGAARPIPGDAQSSGQPAPAPDDPSKVVGGPMVPYGERSRFEDAVREKGPPSMPDEWGANFTPLADLQGIITPSGAPLRGLPGRHSRHRSSDASPADPRHGRSALDPHHG